MTEAVPIRVAPDHERRYPGAEKLATECVINLLRTESLLGASLNRRLRAFGLSSATFNVLMILEGARTPLCPYEIGERLLVTRGTVTGLLDSLERRGLVRRTPHPEDRRMLLIELEPGARDLLREVWAEFFPAEVEATAVLSAREKETLVRLLGKLQRHLEASAGGREASAGGRRASAAGSEASAGGRKVPAERAGKRAG